MKDIIIAGGKGTRLYPGTLSTPNVFHQYMINPEYISHLAY